MPLNLANTGSDNTEHPTFHDELVESIVATDHVEPSLPVRHVNLILDHSAFIRGIGHIKRWFNREYINTNRSTKDGPESIEVAIYIPAYTLHEFDYAKKGATMMATNAREAIRLIEELIEEEYHVLYDDESSGSRLRIKVLIEGPGESGPSWQQCHKFKVHTPKVKDFPNRKTTFDSNRIGARTQEKSAVGEYDGFDDDMFGDFDVEDTTGSHLHKESEIQYEHMMQEQSVEATGEAEAEMPARLKYLIRLVIFKRFLNKNSTQSPQDEWKLVTEDPITQIWSRSYGVDCLNVNEAEFLMLQNYDANSSNHHDPHSYRSEVGAHHHAIDTTQYRYLSLDDPASKLGAAKKFGGLRNKAGKVNRPKARYIEGFVSENAMGVNGESVKKERFDAINFAPRGQGKLWKRPNKKQ